MPYRKYKYDTSYWAQMDYQSVYASSGTIDASTNYTTNFIMEMGNNGVMKVTSEDGTVTYSQRRITIENPYSKSLPEMKEKLVQEVERAISKANIDEVEETVDVVKEPVRLPKVDPEEIASEYRIDAPVSWDSLEQRAIPRWKRLNSMSAGELQRMPCNTEFIYERSNGEMLTCVLYKFGPLKMVMSTIGKLVAPTGLSQLSTPKNFRRFISAVRSNKITIDGTFMVYDEHNGKVTTVKPVKHKSDEEKMETYRKLYGKGNPFDKSMKPRTYSEWEEIKND